MKPERWEQIEKLCQAALDQSDGDRDAFLDGACAGDEALRREVESLLKYQTPAKMFIEAPALEVAAKVAAADQARSLVGERSRQLGILRIRDATVQTSPGTRYPQTPPRRRAAIRAAGTFNLGHSVPRPTPR